MTSSAMARDRNNGEMPTLANRVYDAAHLTGTFTLRSGQTSTEYFDKYRFEAHPALLRDIAAALAPLVPDGIDALAGLEMGGIPIATALSLETGIPARFVRKEAKTYGTCLLAEGGTIEGQRLLVVEDVVSTGGQVLMSTKDLRDRGAKVDTVLCVIDRRPEGSDVFAAEDLDLRALFRMSDLKPS